MDKPDWKDAPEGATHRHSRSLLAHWYKKIEGKWHYYHASGSWNISTSRKDIVDYLEPRP